MGGHLQAGVQVAAREQACIQSASLPQAAPFPGRLLLHAHELLGTAADAFIAFPSPRGALAAMGGSEGEAASEGVRVDARGVMHRLLELQRWDDARECAGPHPRACCSVSRGHWSLLSFSKLLKHLLQSRASLQAHLPVLTFLKELRLGHRLVNLLAPMRFPV